MMIDDDNDDDDNCRCDQPFMMMSTDGTDNDARSVLHH